MIAEEETNKETITVLTTDQIIDQTMVLNKETIVQTTGQAIDLITDQDQIMVQDQATDQDPTMVLDLITGQTMAQTTDQQIHPQIN